MPIYMKYEGIEGPVTGKYKGWIQLQSCELLHRGPRDNEVVVTKLQDSTSPRLLDESIRSQGKKVTIDFISDVEAPYMSLEMENTILTGWSIASGGEKPMESLTLNPTKITYSQKPTAASKDPNHTSVMWDLATE